VIEVRPDPATGQPDLAEGLRALGSRGITRVLVEGGGTLAAALLGRGLVDRLAWFGAPGLMGSDGVPAVGALSLPALSAMPRFRRSLLAEAGEDVVLMFTREE